MHRMTAAESRPMRRDALQKAVNAGARCAPLAANADVFFRDEGEEIASWKARRAKLLTFCRGCPVMNACRELALRDRDGYEQSDELVRGGLSGQELFATRVRQQERLDEARRTDRDVEWARLVELTLLLRSAAGGHAENGHRGKASRAAQNVKVRKIADEVHAVRMARRARMGWGQAA
ncbi:WhiB family transcriptional regulator [Streptomyces sp. NPDC048442]|uniref:WhiB family transcriptional regulator n=1 Tax=Streptomyces sp. NPDC048442 TaxID=3154823 RepID=UPI0034179CDE